MTTPQRGRVIARVIAGLCVVGAVALTGCATIGSGVGGSGSGFGVRDERRVVGSFSEVVAVAVSRRYVFSATPAGIAVYDRLFNAWLPPLSREVGLVDNQIVFMAGDPVEDAVWLGVPGAIIVYRPQSEQFQRTIIIGIPDAIVFERDPRGDAYVRSAGQWLRVSRIGVASPVAGPPAPDKRVVAPTLNEVYTRYPALRSGSPLLFRSQQADRALRPYPITSGTFSPDQPNEVWLGTSGDGLYRVDATMQQATPLRYGLLERGVGALALAADGVWAAGIGASQFRSGLTFASNDLQRWRWIDGTISVPMLGARATSMALRGSRAWIGTERGIVRAQLDAQESLMLWSSLDGLPDDRVLSVSARADGAWIGTARGLVFITDTSDTRNPRTRGITQRLLDNTPIFALQSVGDTLWIGTDAGLVALPPNGIISRPLGTDPALRRRILALAWSDSVLLAATDDAVLRLAPKGGQEPTRILGLDVSVVGRVTKLAIDDRSMVLTGSDGVIVMQRSGGLHVLRVGPDIPGPVLDVAMTRDLIWLATPEGLVRLRRAGDGGLP